MALTNLTENQTRNHFTLTAPPTTHRLSCENFPTQLTNGLTHYLATNKRLTHAAAQEYNDALKQNNFNTRLTTKHKTATMTHDATEQRTFYGTTLPTVKTYRLTWHTHFYN